MVSQPASQPLTSGYLFILREAAEKVGVSLDDIMRIIWTTVAEICEIQRGKRVVRSQLSDVGEIPVYQNSLKPLGYFDESNFEADKTFIIAAGAAGEIGYINKKFWAADDVYVFEPSKSVMSKFIYHFLLTQKNSISSKVRRASIPRLSRTSFENIEISVPILEEQKCIVSILDKFEELTSDLKEGLPKEIELRQKQYEYWREKLLNFNKN